MISTILLCVSLSLVCVPVMLVNFSLPLMIIQSVGCLGVIVNSITVVKEVLREGLLEDE